MSERVNVSGEQTQMSNDEIRAAGLDPHSTTPPPDQTDPQRLRQLSLYLLVGLAFLAFFGRVWDLQVVHGDEYVERAQISRSKLEILPAQRGLIYDRAGTALVRNIPNFTVAIVPAYLPGELYESDENLEVYRRLSLLLNMPVSNVPAGGISDPDAPPGPRAGIKDIVDYAVNHGQNYRQIPIKTNVSRELAMIISEQAMKLPGVQLKVESMRYYPYGSLVSHILGYVGPIPAELVDQYPEDEYDPDVDRVGLTGIEAKYEADLRGVKGRRYIEEDVAGREVQVIGEPQPAMPGRTIYLSLDMGLQQAATEALQAEINNINRAAGQEMTRRGAVIAMQPQTGQILAMVSLPSYDNNLFTRGITQTAWVAISDDVHLPLINHAVADLVPPGSIYKLIPASAALQEKVITPRTIIACPGSIVIPDKYYPNDPGRAKRLTCWYKAGHGNVDLLTGLAQSCDVYFWQVGAGYDVLNQPKFEGLGIDRLASYSQKFGLGKLTGLDIGSEAAGLVPNPTWKRKTFGESWSTGDTYNIAIGQGYLLVTPLQMLNVTAAVANGGTLYKPQVIDRILDDTGQVQVEFRPQVLDKVPVSLQNLQLVQQGMEAAVTSGTSTKAQVPGIRVAGKTGTAEYCDDLAIKLEFCANGKTYPTHAWFVAYAPVENPQIALIVYIYNGGEGSEHAVPVAKKVLDYFFGVKPK